ncbi:hypothetical protein TNCV_2847011 [Trichonephila clavipes]|nr:hypothetical protein TNCV_2847011 [Trichonephila clavipes]
MSLFPGYKVVRHCCCGDYAPCHPDNETDPPDVVTPRINKVLGTINEDVEEETRVLYHWIGARYTRAFGDGPRNFEPWSSDVDDT